MRAFENCLVCGASTENTHSARRGSDALVCGGDCYKQASRNFKRGMSGYKVARLVDLLAQMGEPVTAAQLLARYRDTYGKSAMMGFNNTNAVTQQLMPIVNPETIRVDKTKNPFTFEYLGGTTIGEWLKPSMRAKYESVSFKAESFSSASNWSEYAPTERIIRRLKDSGVWELGDAMDPSDVWFGIKWWATVKIKDGTLVRATEDELGDLTVINIILLDGQYEEGYGRVTVSYTDIDNAEWVDSYQEEMAQLGKELTIIFDNNGMFQSGDDLEYGDMGEFYNVHWESLVSHSCVENAELDSYEDGIIVMECNSCGRTATFRQETPYEGPRKSKDAETFEAEHAPSVEGMIDNPAGYYSYWQSFCEYIGVNDAHTAWRMVEKPWKWRPELEKWVNDSEWFSQEAESFGAEEKCPMPDHEGKKCGKGLYSSRLSPRPSIGRTTRGMMICGDCAGLESYAKGLGEWVDKYPNRRHDAETFGAEELEISVGDRVRSYDFILPDGTLIRDDCYMEGRVTKIAPVDWCGSECDHYYILVDRVVRNGEEIDSKTFTDGQMVFPPVSESYIEVVTSKTFDVEFNDWANQEMMTHGKDISFNDWAEEEGKKHGGMDLTDWAKEEEESHDERYAAETDEYKGPFEVEIRRPNGAVATWKKYDNYGKLIEALEEIVSKRYTPYAIDVFATNVPYISGFTAMGPVTDYRKFHLATWKYGNWESGPWAKHFPTGLE